jgi:hypothetical protein
VANDEIKVQVNKQAKTMTITLPLQTPRESKSGKTMVIASTQGNVRTDAKWDGNPITIGVNAYFKV